MNGHDTIKVKQTHDSGRHCRLKVCSFYKSPTIIAGDACLIARRRDLEVYCSV